MKKTIFVSILVINYFFLFSQSFSKCNIKGSILPDNKKSLLDTSFIITHSLSQEIIPETSVSCNSGGIQYQNSYYRVFDLSSSTFNINGDWTAQKVQVAIGYAKGGIDTVQYAKLILYQMSTYDGTILLENLNQRSDTITFQISDADSGTIKTIPIQPAISIPKGSALVAEVLIPDGQEDGNVLFIGSNDLPQTDKTFIKAKHCTVDEPVDATDIGYPDMHLIINVIGAYNAANPQILSFNIDGQLSDTKITNNPNLISLILPADTTFNNLHPNIVVPAGFYVTPNSGDEVDFSQGEVEFFVTNEYSKITESWLASVSKATPDILSFSISNQVGETIINNTNHTVQVTMPNGTDLSDISPEISVYKGFNVNPSSGSSQDFTLGAVSYNVSHSVIDFSQDWDVTVSTESNINKFSQVHFYPNPAKDFINIISNNFIKAEIYNISAKKMFTFFNKKINISSLEKGLYFIKIYSDNKTMAYKIIKEN